MDALNSDTEYTSIYDIPAPHNLNLSKEWQEEGNIKAWVEITGYDLWFKLNDDNTSYVFNDLEDAVNVKYEAESTLKTGSKVVLDSFSYDLVSTKVTNNTLTATIMCVLKYHTMKKECTGDKPKICKLVKDKDYVQISYFSAVDGNIPTKYEAPEFGMLRANVTYFNNSFNKKIIVSVDISDYNDVLGYNIHTTEGTVTYYEYVFRTNYTDKNYPYAEPVLKQQYYVDTSNLYPKIGTYYQFDGSKIDYTTITCSAIYPNTTVMFPDSAYTRNETYFSLKKTFFNYDTIMGIFRPLWTIFIIVVLFLYLRKGYNL